MENIQRDPGRLNILLRVMTGRSMPTARAGSR